MIELLSSRFVVRPVGEEDLNERYLSWIKDPDINRTLDVGSERPTIDSLKEYVATHDGSKKILFGIYTREGLHIGTHSFNHDGVHKMATLGAMVGDKAFWGKGVILETRSAILDWAFDELGCNKIQSGCYSTNYPAIYNFKRQNWKKEGVLRAHRIVSGESVDLLLFGMLAEEWHGGQQ